MLFIAGAFSLVWNGFLAAAGHGVVHSLDTLSGAHFKQRQQSMQA